MIPQVLHLYWGRNNPLSFLRYMTVVSFSELNPAWEIIVHYPKDTHAGITWDSREHQVDMSGVNDWFNALNDIPNCRTNMIDWGHSAKLPEVMRSDLIRWKLLAEQGGWWSDFDILFIKPMHQLGFHCAARVVGANQRKPSGRELTSIGFLGSDAGSFAKEFFNAVLRNAMSACEPNQYQSAGRFAYEPAHDKWHGDERLYILPSEVVYPIQSWEAGKLYSQFDRPISSFTIGIHWFGGFAQSQEFELLVNNGMMNAQQGWFADKVKASMKQVLA